MMKKSDLVRILGILDLVVVCGCVGKIPVLVSSVASQPLLVGGVVMTAVLVAIFWIHPPHSECQGTDLVLFLPSSPCPFRDREEISWTIWGPSVPHIWLRPIERNHRRSYSTSRLSRLRSSQRWGAIGHSKVQVISCWSLRSVDLYVPALDLP